MESLTPQIKGMLESKDDDGIALLECAMSSENAVIFNVAITFVEDHSNPEEVI